MRCLKATKSGITCDARPCAPRLLCSSGDLPAGRSGTPVQRERWLAPAHQRSRRPALTTHAAAATAAAEALVQTAQPAPAPSATAAWLEAAVQAAVRHIGSCTATTAGASAGPFVVGASQRFGAPFAIVPLPDSDIAGRWPQFIEGAGLEATGRFLLVQPLPAGEQEHEGTCVAARLAAGKEAAETECMQCAAATAADKAAAATCAGAAPVAAGRVGNCSGGDGPNCSSNGNAQPSSSSSSGPRRHSASPPACAPSAPNYYGVVVVQGPAYGGAAPEGCYLLQTTHSVSPALGCTCSQYALTRVAKGPSLSQQLQDSWLV